jgi:hypothetical protein
MDAFWPAALVLLCPIAMGAMMLWMHRRGGGHGDE